MHSSSITHWVDFILTRGVLTSGHVPWNRMVFIWRDQTNTHPLVTHLNASTSHSQVKQTNSMSISANVTVFVYFLSWCRTYKLCHLSKSTMKLSLILATVATAKSVDSSCVDLLGKVRKREREQTFESVKRAMNTRHWALCIVHLTISCVIRHWWMGLKGQGLTISARISLKVWL